MRRILGGTEDDRREERGNDLSISIIWKNRMGWVKFKVEI